MNVSSFSPASTTALVADFPSVPPPDAPPEETLRARARRLHGESPLLDGHNDLPFQLRKLGFSEVDLRQEQTRVHTDITRLRAGGVGGVFWAAYPNSRLSKETALIHTLEAFDIIYQMLDTYPGDLELALTADDAVRIFRQGKIVSFIGVEGGQSIVNSLGVLRMFYRLGARYLTLTHNFNVDWADSATDALRHGGLSNFGREVIWEMNRLGMMVDISHVAPGVMHDVLQATHSPIIFSHSNAYALTQHPRNVPDDVLERIPLNRGIVMANIAPQFVNQAMADWMVARNAWRDELERAHPGDESTVNAALARWDEDHARPEVTLSDVADHIDYLVKKVGVDHVGIGTDFDGVRYLPVGLEDVSCSLNTTVELLRRGYSDEDLKKILGLNLLRVMRENEAIAAQLQREATPSAARIEIVDATPSLPPTGA